MGRMRTLKPNYNRSLDIVPLTVICRYHFTLLWTYADDEGRGLDVPALIRSELWPLDGDLIDDAQIEEWQVELEENGRIVRYEADRPYFQILDFTFHQHPQRPQPSVIPPPDCASRTTRVLVRDDASTGTRAVLPVVVEVDVGGVVEGEVDAHAHSAQVVPLISEPSLDDFFIDFWAAYPRKVDKKRARAAYGKAVKRVSPGELLEALRPWVRHWAANDPQFTPHPSTWLNGERWNDEPSPPARLKVNRVDDNNRLLAQRILEQTRTDVS